MVCRVNEYLHWQQWELSTLLCLRFSSTHRCAGWLKLLLARRYLDAILNARLGGTQPLFSREGWILFFFFFFFLVSSKMPRRFFIWDSKQRLRWLNWNQMCTRVRPRRFSCIAAAAAAARMKHSKGLWFIDACWLFKSTLRAFNLRRVRQCLYRLSSI